MNTVEPSLSFAGSSQSKSVTAVLLGCPYEEPEAIRKGASKAPEAIRKISHRSDFRYYGCGGAVKTDAFADYGDIEVQNRSQKEIFAETEARAEAILSEHKVLFCLGGSGAVNYPLLKAAKKIYPRCKVLSLDAHRGNEPCGDEITHGNVFSALLREDILRPEERYYWGQSGRVKTEKSCCEYRSPAVKKGVLGEMHRLYRYPVFVTVDVDVMDPPFAPGSGHPVYGGIETAELFQTVDLLKSLNVIGMSLTEVVPAYDPSGITTVLAATVLKECLRNVLTKSEKNY